MAKTNAQRVRESESRKKAGGMVKAWVWCFPEDREAIRQYAIRKYQKRLKESRLD